jgi:aminopeptidase N
MLLAQLADRSDLIGRLLAIEELGKRKDQQTIDRLKETLNSDPFYGVRIAASQALRGIQNDKAFESLAASGTQSDARVRRQVVSDTSSFYREASFTASTKVLEKEKNPEIRAIAISSLGPYPKKDVEPILLRQLKSDSHRNRLADASIAAMRAQNDPSYINPILTALQEGEAKFTAGGFARGLETLAYLAREQEKKDVVREFITQRVNHKRRAIQLAALNALGILGDTKAIAVLETFTAGQKDSPQRTTAEKAVSALRETRKSSAELGNLRNEVLSLQKENRDIRKEFDDLKRKLEAALPKAALLKTNKPASSARSPKP